MDALAQDIRDWLGADHMGPLANQLRCAAMCAQEDGVQRKDFVAACVSLGVNKGTAGNRWNEVKNQ